MKIWKSDPDSPALIIQIASSSHDEASHTQWLEFLMNKLVPAVGSCSRIRIQSNLSILLLLPHHHHHIPPMGDSGRTTQWMIMNEWKVLDWLQPTSGWNNTEIQRGLQTKSKPDLKSSSSSSWLLSSSTDRQERRSLTKSLSVSLFFSMKFMEGHTIHEALAGKDMKMRRPEFSPLIHP